jgi:hypothetical protein
MKQDFFSDIGSLKKRTLEEEKKLARDDWTDKCKRDHYLGATHIQWLNI